MRAAVALLCIVLTGLVSQPVYGKKTEQSEAGGLFAVYEQNRQQGIGNYITADFLLLAYGMLRRQDIHRVEQETIRPAFALLLDGIVEQLGEKSDPASAANRDFMAVMRALLAGSKVVEKAADAKRATAELQHVLGAKGISKSPLWGYSLDYSMFIPRAYYTRSPETGHYFQAMAYGSQVLFAVRESEATGIDGKLADRLTAQAMQLAEIISENKILLKCYTAINDQLAFRMGRADDLVLADLSGVAEKHVKTVAGVRAELFRMAGKLHKKPRILANIVDRNKLEKGVSGADVLTGFRFFPQRYAPDSAFFQALVAPESGDFTGSNIPFGLTTINGKPAKGFISGYELMASLGSLEADRWLDAHGEKNFSGYKEVTANGRRELAEAEGLDALHLLLLRDLFRGVGDDRDDTLTLGLAFWTWQRYVNLLYTKQSVTMVGKSVSFGPERTNATLEVAGSLYTDLLNISREYGAHSEGENKKNWNDFSVLVQKCILLADKVSGHVSLLPEEIFFLNSLDSRLLVLTAGKDYPIVVDVHTEPNSRMVVEEATGLPVVVMQGAARGARMSHYEFKHPLQDRLSDEKWRELLRHGGGKK